MLGYQSTIIIKKPVQYFSPEGKHPKGIEAMVREFDQGDEFSEVVKRDYEVTSGEVFYITKVGEEQRVERRVYRNR